MSGEEERWGGDAEAEMKYKRTGLRRRRPWT